MTGGTAAESSQNADGGVRLSVVVPAFNEAGRLPATLASIAAFLDGRPDWRPAEVVVVDDGSDDGTAAAAAGVELGSGTDLVVRRHPGNRGKGAAVRTGFAASRGSWVLLSDADLATPVEEIDRLAAGLHENAVAIGSRALDRSLISVRQPWYRDFMGRTFNLLVRAAVLPGIRDTQCGFKLFPGPLARALAAAQRLDGFAYDVELLLLARRWGFVLREVPVRWRHVEASRVAPGRHSVQMLRDVVRLAARRALGLLPPRPRL